MSDEATERAAAEWMRSRPDAVQALMRRFPPLCEIESPGGHYSCPGAFGNAEVYSYMEDGETMGVRRTGDFAEIDGHIVYHVSAAKVSVVRCHDGRGRDWVASVLDDDAP